MKWSTKHYSQNRDASTIFYSNQTKGHSSTIHRLPYEELICTFMLQTDLSDLKGLRKAKQDKKLVGSSQREGNEIYLNIHCFTSQYQITSQYQTNLNFAPGIRPFHNPYYCQRAQLYHVQLAAVVQTSANIAASSKTC